MPGSSLSEDRHPLPIIADSATQCERAALSVDKPPLSIAGRRRSISTGKDQILS